MLQYVESYSKTPAGTSNTSETPASLNRLTPNTKHPTTLPSTIFTHLTETSKATIKSKKTSAETPKKSESEDVLVRGFNHKEDNSLEH